LNVILPREFFRTTSVDLNVEEDVDGLTGSLTESSPPTDESASGLSAEPGPPHMAFIDPVGSEVGLLGLLGVLLKLSVS
jgi:hypothetical protein